MLKVSYDDLFTFGRRLLATLGFADDDARYIAETSAFTQAGGVHTHGSTLLAAIESQCGKQIDPQARPKIVHEMAAMALIDSNNAAGPVCLRLAVELARTKARQAGAAVVSVRNSSWIAGLGGYLVPLADEGFFAQLAAQSSQCQDAAPAGGIEPCFSTNPLALAWPGGSGPIVADFSTAAMSMGKAGTLARAGQKASAAVFITPEGQLTDDPKVMSAGGAMLPAGGLFDGHKGYAFAFWIDALTAMAGGNCNNPKFDQRQSFTLMLISADAFGKTDWLRSEMKRMADRIHNTRPLPGQQAVRLPGERFLAQAERSKRDGVELPEPLLDKLNELAGRHGVQPLSPMPPGERIA